MSNTLQHTVFFLDECRVVAGTNRVLLKDALAVSLQLARTPKPTFPLTLDTADTPRGEGGECRLVGGAAHRSRLQTALPLGRVGREQNLLLQAATTLQQKRLQ